MRGAAFWVYTPRDRNGANSGADPAVYQDDVIGYEFDAEGTRICASEYLHMRKIKDIRIQGADDIIPTGWEVCGPAADMDPATLERTGNAGTFNLHDFGTTVQPLGGEAVNRAAMPRHKSSAEAQASRNGVEYFDALGWAPDTILAPNTGDADTSVAGADPHNHQFQVEMGSYVTCTVMFIQRYK